MIHHLGFVHTVSRLAPTFTALADELLPATQTTTITDELLLKETIRGGAVSEATVCRLEGHVAALAAFGVEGVLVTCSSLGVAVDRIGAQSRVPVLRVDRPMAELAVSLGPRIGVLATLATTLEPTADLVRRTSHDHGVSVQVLARVCEGAFAALGRGDTERHDAIVADELDRLVEQVDVVVLAQASMARIADGRGGGAIPILSSPRLVMQRLAGVAAADVAEGER